MPPEGPRRGRKRGDLTVATIARLAGVSPPTVSRVLNGRAGVAAETRRRVEALLREHDYRRPEPVAPAASVEGVFYGLESYMAVEVLRGVEQVARDHDLAVGFTEVQGRASVGESWIQQLTQRRPIGVVAVLMGFAPPEYGDLTLDALPVVALDPTGEPVHAVPSVGASNWNGGIAATRHLLDLGHRRIGVVSGPSQVMCARARLEGCRAALDAAGTPLERSLLRIGDFRFETGLTHGTDLLSRPNRPTAILCGNDLQALGVYEAARRAGLRIPQDLSVIGFDDLECVRWCGPPLTTVRQPVEEMGTAATQLLLDLAAGKEPERTRIELSTTLIIRDSTAVPAPSSSIVHGP